MTAETEWISAQVDDRGKPVLIRLQNVRLDAAMIERYPHLVTVTVAYAPSKKNGLPSPQQYDVLGTYEDTLFDAFEEREGGIVAVVRTYDGSVEYQLYVADVEATVAMARTNESPFATTFAVTEGDHWKTFIAARVALPKE